MISDSQWEKAVEKLLEQTNNGNIRWKAIDSLKRDGIQGQAYVVSVAGRTIAVYEHQYKYYADEFAWEWKNTVAVEFVDENLELQWRWPASTIRWSLIDAIRFQVSNASRFIEEFLGAKSEGTPQHA
jgi:hypothetical protein